MVIAPVSIVSMFHDALIITGTAIAFALLLDLQKRLSDRQQVRVALPLLILGWIAMLGMSGPAPFPAGAAFCLGLCLTAVALLIPATTRLLRRGRAEHRRRN